MYDDRNYFDTIGEEFDYKTSLEVNRFKKDDFTKCGLSEEAVAQAIQIAEKLSGGRQYKQANRKRIVAISAWQASLETGKNQGLGIFLDRFGINPRTVQSTLAKFSPIITDFEIVQNEISAVDLIEKYWNILTTPLKLAPEDFSRFKNFFKSINSHPLAKDLKPQTFLAVSLIYFFKLYNIATRETIVKILSPEIRVSPAVIRHIDLIIDKIYNS